MSETDDTQSNDDEITTEPPDPLAGAEDSVAKVGERLQEEVDAADEANGEGDGDGA
jgi:hypothetical protein